MLARCVLGSANLKYRSRGALPSFYYRSRCHSPQLGRFISQDPSGFAGADTNLYAYTGSDPINSRDPLGLQSIGQNWLVVQHTSNWFNFAGEDVQMFGILQSGMALRIWISVRARPR